MVSAELWSGNTKLADLSPKNPYFVASIGAVGTNQFRSWSTITSGRRPPHRNDAWWVATRRRSWGGAIISAVDPGTPS